jgi:hypothetical protein
MRDKKASMEPKDLTPEQLKKAKAGNAFWKKLGFHEGRDLAYRDRSLVKTVRTD